MSAVRKRTALLAGVATLAGGLIMPVVAATSASASTPTNYRFNAVGSDTIFCVDNAVAAKYNTAQASKTGNEVDNTPPVLSFGFGCETSPSSFTVPSDSVHAKIKYKCTLKVAGTASLQQTVNPITSIPTSNTLAALQSGKGVTLVDGSNTQTFTVSAAVAQGSTSIPVVSETPNFAYPIGTTVDAPDCVPGDGATGNLPPDGSSAGIAALVADNGAGNVAYARSSSGRTSSNPSTIDFWAFALDAVTWSSFPGYAGPADLTTTDITDIYNCTYTDWSQVPGSTFSGTILRYFPQVGSGTGKFFATLFTGGVYPSNTGTCPVTYAEENQGASVAALAGANVADAIFPYSVAVWTAQQPGGPDFQSGITGGATLGSVDGTTPTTAHISETAANTNISGDACNSPVSGEFCGSRFVYHVTDQALATSHSAYQAQIIKEVGVPASGVAKGFCDNKYASEITAYGFVPLALAPTAQSTSSDPVPGTSYCRQF